MRIVQAVTSLALQVALGAAIQGHALVEDKNDMILLDVTPHALGIMTFGSHFEELIPQNTTVPTSRTKVFTTSRDNQTAVKILVMQGENDNAEKNELLGEFILTGLRRAPKGEVEIEVTFEINTDGIVSVPLNPGNLDSDLYRHVPGLVTFSGSAFTGVLALLRGNDWGWSSGRVVGLFAAAVLLLLAFAWIQLRATRPTFDLRLFRVPSIPMSRPPGRAAASSGCGNDRITSGGCTGKPAAVL